MVSFRRTIILKSILNQSTTSNRTARRLCHSKDEVVLVTPRAFHPATTWTRQKTPSAREVDPSCPSIDLGSSRTRRDLVSYKAAEQKTAQQLKVKNKQNQRFETNGVRGSLSGMLLLAMCFSALAANRFV